MKKNLYFLLFIFIVTIVSFVSIDNVEASEYSSFTCKYGYGNSLDNTNAGGSGVQRLSIEIGYSEKGELIMPKSIPYTITRRGNCRYDEKCPDVTETINYKVVNVDFNKKDFLSGNTLATVCPGNNDVDLYFDEDNEKIYIAKTEKSLKNYLDSHNIDYGEGFFGLGSDIEKAGLYAANVVNGEKIIVNGKTYNIEDKIDCHYENKTYNHDIYLSIGKTSNKVLSATTSNSTNTMVMESISGTFMGNRCPKRISINHRTVRVATPTASTAAPRIELFRDPDEGKYELELVENKKDDPNVDGPYIDLSGESGCGLWGSLLGLLRDDVFGLIKYSLIGLLIVFGMLDFSKAIFSGEDNTMKKAASKFVKRIVVVVIIFLLPLLIETFINLILSSEGVDVKTCISDF